MSATVLQSTKKVLLTRHRAFNDQSRVLVGDTVTVVANLGFLKPLALSAVSKLDITFGVDDDPGDELVEWFLIVADPNNLPDLVSLRLVSEWSTAQNWRVIVAGDSTIQTFTHLDVEFWDPKFHSTMGIDERRQELSLLLVVVSNTTSQVTTIGHAVWKTELLQRRFRGRKKGRSEFVKRRRRPTR